MRPDEPQQPARMNGTSQQQREAATSIARQQVDQAFGSAAQQSVFMSPEGEQLAQPYRRTHEPVHTVKEADWSQYHSAWQSYYQQYYERYYAQHLAQTQSSSEPDVNAPTETASITKDSALQEIRGRLRDTVQARARAVRASRHFGPIVAAVSVMIVFGFIQYNQVVFGAVHAYVQPGMVDPQNIIVDPSLATNVDPSSRRVIIPKINVDAPVSYNTTPDYKSQIAAMRHGLAYFGIPGANSKPGQKGVTAIAGHSSSDAFSSSTYKFVFSQLEKLRKDDIIYVTYQGTRYTYAVTGKRVVKPTEVRAIIQETDKPLLTLITCTPVGTAKNRLLVDAVQVNPSPVKATSAPKTTDTASVDSIAGTEPTLFGRLFGAR